MRRLTRFAAILTFAGLHGLAPEARAQASAADRETARALVIAGRAKLEARDFTGALKDLKAAHAIMGVPTTGLDLAKAQVALGQLVEARVTALEASRLPVLRAEAPAFGKARVAAAALADELGPRIPSVTITIHGPTPGAPAVVSFDGAEIKREALGVPLKTNPGEHSLVARADGFIDQQRRIELREGESQVLELTLEPRPRERTAATAPAAPDSSPAETSAPTWAWVIGGTGIAAGVAAVGCAIDHAGAQSRIGDDCPDGACDPDKYSLEEVEALDARRTRSGYLAIGLGAAAGVGLAVAATGFLVFRTSASSASTTRLWLSPTAGPGIAGGGRF